MKNLHYALIVGKDEHYRAYAVEFPQNGNLVSLVKKHCNLQIMQCCESKNAAETLVAAWNADFRQCGTYDELLI